MSMFSKKQQQYMVWMYKDINIHNKSILYLGNIVYICCKYMYVVWMTYKRDLHPCTFTSNFTVVTVITAHSDIVYYKFKSRCSYEIFYQYVLNSHKVSEK
ncbi:hypothetical protein ACF0H5_000573 [Mactra antiquata]